MNIKLLCKFSCAMWLMLLACTTLYAQGRKITGRVVDQEDHKPMPGVNVSIKGSPSNVSTNAEGLYTIQVNSTSEVLVFSYIGYVRQTITVGAQANIDVSMASDSKGLDEVVVVGYGSQKRSHLTGAVATVNMKAIEDLPGGGLAAALQGQLPAVSVSGGNSRPGSPATITIRNPQILSKDGGTTEPLYIIDDVIRTSEDFNVLDQSEVENISVLKDAAASIYGARAGQGVVIVKTKRGKAGAPKFSYSGSIGTADASMLPKMMNGYDLAVYRNDILQANNKFMLSPTGVHLDDPTSKESDYYSPDELDYFKGHNYDWLDMAWKSSMIQRHTMNVSGGSEKATYFASATYNTQDGNFDNINSNRWTFRASADVQATKNLKLALSLSGDMSDKKLYWLKQGSENAENDIRALLYTPQFIPPYVDGLPVFITAGGATNSTLDNFHFFEVQNSNNYTETKSTGLNVNTNLEYTIPFIKGLKARVLYSKNLQNNFGKQYGTKYNVYNRAMLGENKHIYGGDVISVISLKNGDQVRLTPDYTESYQFNGYLNYDRTFGKHQISAIALFEQSESSSDGLAGSQESPIIGGLDNISYATGAKEVTESQKESGNLSYVGRINYSYANKYLVELSGRFDASTNFAPENRWGFFPSGSVGWVISEEDFFKNNVKGIDFLKLRGSIGLAGADNTKAYNWLSTYTAFQTGQAAVFGENNPRGLGVSPNNSIANRNITWDSKMMYDAGLDAQFLNNRLSVTIDGFYNHNYNMLTSLTSSVPLLVGAALPSENYGIVNGFGTELSVGWNDKITEDWHYNVSTFLSWNDNKQIKIDRSQGDIGTFLDPLGHSSDRGVRGLKYIGMFRTQQEVDTYLAAHPNYTIYGDIPKPGMLYYEDVRGPKDASGNYTGPDGKITDEDEQFLTHKQSNHYGFGLNFSVSYKTLTVSASTGGSFGGQDVIGDAVKPASDNANLPVFWRDHWTPENTNAAYPNPAYDNNYDHTSSFWFRNSFVFRMTNFNISYGLPSKFASKLGISSLRAFLVSTNPFNFYNPYDYKMYSGAYNAYPVIKTFSFGLNIGL